MARASVPVWVAREAAAIAGAAPAARRERFSLGELTPRSVEVDDVDDVDEPPWDAQLGALPPPDNRLARAEWMRDTRYLPPGPPYDLPARLAGMQRDVEYVIGEVRTSRQLAQLWYDRCTAYEDAVRALVMAADRGGSLTKHLDRLRELLPPTRYRRRRS